jgi:signal transduction histidine kinase
MLLVAALLPFSSPSPSLCATPISDEAALAETRRALGELPSAIPSEQGHGRIGFYGLPDEPARLVVDLGEEVAPDEVVLFPARLPTDVGGGDGSNGFPSALAVSIAPDKSLERTIRLAGWSEAAPGEGNRHPFLRLPGNGASGRFLVVEILGARPRESGRGFFYTLGEIVVLERGRNAALGRPVAATRSTENAPRWQAANLTDGFLWCLPFAGSPAAAPANGYHSAIESSPEAIPKWVEVDLGRERVLDEIHLVPAHPRDFADVGGFGFPPRLRVLGRDEGGGETVLFESGPAPLPNPGAAALMVSIGQAPVRHLRVEALELWQRTGDYIFALAELRALVEGENAALGATVSAADTTTTGSWSLAALVDGSSSRHELLGWSGWLEALDQRERLQARADRLAGSIALAREERNRRLLALSVFLALLIAALGAAALLVQRRRAAREREALRARLAGDLHDELGASLSHLALQSDLARRRVAPDDPVSERLVALSGTARESLDHLRDSVWLLSPTASTWSELDSRLAAIASRLLEGIEREIRREGDPPPGLAPVDLSRELVLFLKESLTNLRRHAGAARAEVSAAWSASELVLSIADDGCGFDREAEGFRPGRGLANCEARAKALGARCQIESQPGHGTRIRLSLPLPRSRRR